MQSIFKKIPVPFVTSLSTSLGGLPPFCLLFFLLSLVFLLVQLGTIRILKVRPKPCWILPGNGWLAVFQEAFQSGIILMNFSQSKVWPEDLQFQKFNLVSVPGFAWFGRADLCELNWQKTKTSHQNAILLSSRACAAVREIKCEINI